MAFKLTSKSDNFLIKMDYLFVEFFQITDKISLSIESLITLIVFKHCSSDLKLKLIRVENAKNEVVFELDTRCVLDSFEIIENLPDLAKFCHLPLVIIKNTTVISGLCSVARQIVKNSASEEIQKLLGFREACLMAPNECSIWTKFCEIDMVQSIKNIFMTPQNFLGPENVIPKDLTRFEIHMSQPVRIHNIYKVAQNDAKQNGDLKEEITTKIKKENLNLSHIYGEGPFMTLADLILYPQIFIFKKIYGEIFEKHLPRVDTWINKMADHVGNVDINFTNSSKFEIPKNANVTESKIEKTSLYVSDPKRYKPRNRIFTKQTDIENSLEKVVELTSNIKISGPIGFEFDFDWDLVPNEANPLGGALPEKRMLRKRDQLENLARATVKIAKDGDVIVDFCSGSGHLGILLAVKLPKCKIILLENKEKSLFRAKERCDNLKLSNVIFLQCNLDYFNAPFNIGVSLHACGVATDLVIQHCLRRQAHFVSCPCCYGGVHETHHISYPRSQIFKNSTLTLRDYLVLGHSADQTHDSENAKTKQGFECMNIIDYDRKLQAEEFGYEVFLSKMVPENCTPKNNILIGLYKSEIIS